MAVDSYAALQAGSNIPQAAADYRSCLAVGNGQMGLVSGVHRLLALMPLGSVACIPLGSDANKLALFELIIACELNEIHGLDFRKVKVRVPMDTEEATNALTAKLPVELAETIVASAVSED